MPVATKPSRNSNQIAVIRSYEPIRIESELLAQVFDLAHRGPAAGSACVGNGGVAANEPPHDLTQHGWTDPCCGQQANDPETVL